MKKIILLIGALILTYRAFAAERGGSKTNCPFPVMPVKAAALKISGTVNYAAWVSDKGEVYSVSTTGDDIFFEEMQRAMKKCRFEPGHPGIERGTSKFSFVDPK